MRVRVFMLLALLIVLVVGGFPARAAPLAQDIKNYTVLSVEEYPLLAGPAATSAYLSPDGDRLAHFTIQAICIYESSAQDPDCVSLEDLDLRPELETVQWSPDGRYIAFTNNNFFMTYKDSDLWVLDTESGTLQNLTDGQEREDSALLSGETWDKVDVVPRWFNDSARLAFLRYSGTKSQFNPPQLMTVARDGSDHQIIATLDVSDNPAWIYAFDLSPDNTQFVFNVWGSNDDPNNGVWIGNLDEGDVRQLVQTDLVDIPDSVEFSPDGQFLLAVMPRAAMVADFSPEESMMRVINVETGDMNLLNEAHYVVGAAWESSGHAVAYLVNERMNEDISGVYLTPEPGDPGQMVYQGLYVPPTSVWKRAMTWAANDRLLISRSPQEGVLVLQFGAE